MSDAEKDIVERLKPCPFCGSDRITVFNIRDGQQAACKDCKSGGSPTYHGPNGPAATWGEAVKAWNTRAAKPTLRAEVERLTKERDIAVGERVARANTMRRLRDRFINICNDLDDEGDRIYFGSTNDADTFRNIVEDLESWNWHDVLRDTQKVDPFAASREAIARAEKAEAALAKMRDHYDNVDMSHEAFRVMASVEADKVLGGRYEAEAVAFVESLTEGE